MVRFYHFVLPQRSYTTSVNPAGDYTSDRDFPDNWIGCHGLLNVLPDLTFYCFLGCRLKLPVTIDSTKPQVHGEKCQLHKLKKIRKQLCITIAYTRRRTTNNRIQYSNATLRLDVRFRNLFHVTR